MSDVDWSNAPAPGSSPLGGSIADAFPGGVLPGGGPLPGGDPWVRSREAEARAKLKADEVRLLVLRYLANGTTWTDPELYGIASDRYAVSPSGLRTRRSELVSLGLVQSVGTRDNCTTWETTEAGKALTYNPNRAQLLRDMWQAFRDRPDSFPSATELLREIVSMARAGFSIDHLLDEAEELLK